MNQLTAQTIVHMLNQALFGFMLRNAVIFKIIDSALRVKTYILKTFACIQQGTSVSKQFQPNPFMHFCSIEHWPLCDKCKNLVC